ncbi:bifunctional hydroxymethylpyrimidine kinase/phosphomethylpyrimidine kinase [Pseudodesulfovibrio sp.]|uniref:bifunctional hydroxymethylpyrimidine kinase/phosphomethylpyrimidine kinase n=1 Tax=unclassified Pseudodesulfovibrio TaxID=2661612 RepID=UPI003B00A65B
MGGHAHILTIAGSDSGGGAGIQADLKAITMLRGYGASVITALTAQNTHAVTGIQAPSDKFVAQQLSAVLEDIRVDAAKTGMLFSEPIIKAIAPILSKREFPLVVDPVCVATSGAKLLKDDAVKAMQRLMFPLADLLTPNIPETELFTKMRIRDRDDIFKAARILLDMGPKAVLIKGGHTDSLASTDWYVPSDGEPLPFMQPRIDTNCTHGTGCTLSASIATGLGQGMEMGAAIKRAQEYLNLCLRAAEPIGEGGGPPDHLVPWVKESARPGLLRDLVRFGIRLEGWPELAALLPRGRSNAVVAMPYADNEEEVAGFPGGIIATRKNDVRVIGNPEFGASLLTAKTVLAALRLRPELRCGMTVGLRPGVKQALDAAGIATVWIDRDKRPDYIREDNGALEEWGAFEGIRDHAAPEKVQAVGDPGEMGVEPVVRLLASDFEELEEMLNRILSCLRDA